MTPMRIAIVGSGISGLVCAHLLDPLHDIVVYEADDRLGGHTNTVDVDDPDVGWLAIDTGFIVHNDRNYPLLTTLFQELDVTTQDSEMSFGVTDRDRHSSSTGFCYRATNLNTLFADRSNLVRPAMWRMLGDIVRFYRNAHRFLAKPDPTLTTAEFVASGRYSREFVDLHLVPMGAAVWSADPTTFLEFPAQSLLTFLNNHGLLGLRDRPQWRTVTGGARTYVDAIAKRLHGSVRLSCAVRSVAPVGGARIEVVTDEGRDEFDRVILAVHSDQALRMITTPTEPQRALLDAVTYQPNRATLHTDTSLLPPRRRAWSAWNYDRVGPTQSLATLTYDLTALQRLPGSTRYLVTLNGDDRIDPTTVLASFDYAHPVFDQAAIAAQQQWDAVDGDNGIHLCGAWLGYGFHEDGVRSAVRVARRLGAQWPT